MAKQTNKTFTFKDQNPTGRWRSFENMYVNIKLDKKICGGIHEVTQTEWKIKFMVKRIPDQKQPAPFKWITLKHVATSKVEAKEWLKLRTESIAMQLDLYLQED